MRRPLNESADEPGPWHRFFFTPADPTPLGLVRAATGLLLFWSLAAIGLDLRAFLGPGGWADPATTRLAMGPHGWSFWLIVPDALLWPTWAACLVVLAMFALGLFSRVTAPLAWIIAVSTSRRMPVALFGFDAIVSTWTFYLAFTFACGQAVSLDRRLARRRGGAADPPRPSVEANLGLRLIQLHLCWIYLAAGLAKLQGRSWWDGSAIGKLLGNNEFRPFDLSWLAAYPATELALNLATHLALAVELAYAVLVWRPRLGPWVVGAAVMMHLGIALTLGLVEFSLAMIAGNLAFVPAAAWRRVLAVGRGRGWTSEVQSKGGGSAATPAPARPRRATR